MSVGSAIILDMYERWNKYTHVCQTCDALIEYTSTRVVSEITCECGGKCNWVSQEPATIQPLDKTKEEQMEATTTYLEEQIRILQDTLKSHQNCDYWKSENGRVQSQIIELINEAYTDDIDATNIVETLCQIIDYNPVKEIEFTATMKFTGKIEVNLLELDSFDLEEILSDAYVDINHGDVVIDGYELYDAEEC